MPPVRVGVIPIAADFDRRAVLAAARAEGLDHVVEVDHVSFFNGAGFDGLLRSAQDLAIEPSLGVYLAVYLLPLRHPAVVARQIVDIVQDAPGQLIFGVGIGGEDRHEIELCGVDPGRRGRRQDESLQILRGLLTGEPVTFHGEFFDLDDALVRPAPSIPVPIVVGGRSDAALRRAGRLGDGWVAIWVSARRFREGLTIVEDVAADAGRVVEWHHAIQIWAGVDDDRDRARELVAWQMEALYQVPFDKFERWTPYGTPADVAEFVAPYVEAGAKYVNLMVSAGNCEQAVAAAGEVRRLLQR
ncbi:MAG: LLM class flavin-dependent oxidoreductase [Acidimicrobiales bacterium]|nr:LLM class flavin-dependent oxidoreductase [Acidimicrobiales bacterium]